MAETKDHPWGEKFPRTCYLLPTVYKRVQHCHGPDYRLSKKVVFAWSNAAAKTFVEIKARIVGALVMRLSDFFKDFWSSMWRIRHRYRWSLSSRRTSSCL